MFVIFLAGFVVDVVVVVRRIEAAPQMSFSLIDSGTSEVTGPHYRVGPVIHPRSTPAFL